MTIIFSDQRPPSVSYMMTERQVRTEDKIIFQWGESSDKDDLKGHIPKESGPYIVTDVVASPGIKKGWSMVFFKYNED